MNPLRQAAENFLYSYLALVNSGDCGNWDPETEAEVIALRQAIAESRSSELQEPVAWQWCRSGHFRKKIPKTACPEDWRPLYITPPQKQWVGLTDDDIDEAARFCVKSGQSVNSAIRAIEAKLKEKNT